MSTTHTTPVGNPVADTLPKGRSLWADAGKRFSKNKLAIASVVALLLIIVMAFLAPLLTPWPYDVILNNEAMFSDTYAVFNASPYT